MKCKNCYHEVNVSYKKCENCGETINDVDRINYLESLLKKSKNKKEQRLFQFMIYSIKNSSYQVNNDFNMNNMQSKIVSKIKMLNISRILIYIFIIILTIIAFCCGYNWATALGPNDGTRSLGFVFEMVPIIIGVSVGLIIGTNILFKKLINKGEFKNQIIDYISKKRY